MGNMACIHLPCRTSDRPSKTFLVLAKNEAARSGCLIDRDRPNTSKGKTMGFLDDAIGDAMILGGQMAYFKIKNNQRAKALTKWAKTHDFTFCNKPAEYTGEIMRLPTADPDAAKVRGGHALSAKASMAHRFFGDSQMQTKLWAFCSNRFRGDWQTNANILEGRWKGTLMTAFDTLWFDLTGDNEGE